MAASESENWEQALNDACFPISLADVYVGVPARRTRRYRAVVPLGTSFDDDPFAIVTDKYRLIRNEDVVDLGHEAFDRLFGPHNRSKMTVFNVVLATHRGSFFADFTSPELDCIIKIPSYTTSVDQYGTDPSRHRFFLRVVNSYNRTQAVRIEAGICRWICRNGMIFGKQSIQFKDPHHKTIHQLTDQIAQEAELLPTFDLTSRIGTIYGIPLAKEVSVLECVWQTLRLAIPPVDPKSRNAKQWQGRCATLISLCHDYHEEHGKTAFSVLQAASQWAREQTQISPIQRHSYERRCGEMLERLIVDERWPNPDQNAADQVRRIRDWSNVAIRSN